MTSSEAAPRRTAESVHRWRVRLAIQSVGRHGLNPAVVTYLERELEHLSLSTVSSPWPATAELVVIADGPKLAFDYAATRIRRTLATGGLNKAQCELLDVTADVRDR